MSELDETLGVALTLTADQRARVATTLSTWVRTRTPLADADPRVRQLLREVGILASKFELQLDPQHGLVVDARGASAATTLARGTLWLRGGDWQTVALTTVSSTTPTNHP